MEGIWRRSTITTEDPETPDRKIRNPVERVLTATEAWTQPDGMTVLLDGPVEEGRRWLLLVKIKVIELEEAGG